MKTLARKILPGICLNSSIVFSDERLQLVAQDDGTFAIQNKNNRVYIRTNAGSTEIARGSITADMKYSIEKLERKNVNGELSPRFLHQLFLVVVAIKLSDTQFFTLSSGGALTMTRFG